MMITGGLPKTPKASNFKLKAIFKFLPLALPVAVRKKVQAALSPSTKRGE